MKCYLIFLISLFFILNNAYSQNDFKPVKELDRIRGLPDPFLKPDGSRIQSEKEWKEQREYIISMLEHYQYGKMPATPKDVVVKETLSQDIYDGLATKKLYTLTLKRNGKFLDFHFGLIKPKGEGPFPAIISYTFHYNQKGKINDLLDEVNMEALNRVYIICQFNREDLSTDISGKVIENRKKGVFPLYPEYSWGTIAAWAWGYQLIIDYFEKLDFVDLNKIVATGHSRGGKTAFCAGIFDDRIAITAPNSSGLGGTSSHQFYQPAVLDNQHISDHIITFPYWWTAEYYKLAGFETRIPFDAHFGKASIAPRAFFNCHAYQDYWASPFGAWLTYDAAKEVYKWLGVENNIGMHFRTGGHSQNVIDWFALLDFSDQYFYNKKPQQKYDVKYDLHKTDPYPGIRIPKSWTPPKKE